MEQKKIAIITGGNRGLGKDMALTMSEKGHNIILTYNQNRDEAEQVVNEIQNAGNKAAALQLDLSKISSIPVFVKDVEQALNVNFDNNKIDFLINNAGIGKTIPFMEVTEENFDEFLNIHFKGVYFLTQKLLPIMNDHGSIVNLSTGTTRFSNPGYSVYASMKGAIEVSTKYLAKELGARGIRANVIAPGPIETDFNNAAIRSNPQMKSFLSSLSPLGRVGQANDIGSVVAFLCSEDAKWINGQRIEVSGGINV